MQGGAGYEIWQYLDRKPEKAKEILEVGDLGINVAVIKSRDIVKSYDRLKSKGVTCLTEINEDPSGTKSFYIQDPYDNMLQIKEFDAWYQNGKSDVGGICGSMLGVSDIDKALKLYRDILGYSVVLYDETGTFADLEPLPKGEERFRRILLTHEPNRIGGFSKLLGKSQLELIQRMDSKPKKIFKDRYWGDLGFIHLCFDIRNMKSLVQECKEKGFPFKVLSDESFQMGDTNGHWGYIEDQDGTLIEFVEAFKVPLLKKIGLNINLKDRDPKKPLPNWLIKAMRFKRVKFKNT